MALSGTISKSITGRKYYIDWSATQSVSGNYSTVTCKHYLKNDSTYSLYINSKSNTCTVGGVSDSFTSPAISTGGGSTISLGTTTHKVSHNADGTKSVTIKGVFNIQATLSGTYYSSLTASGTVTLDTIPRASSVSATAANVGSASSISISRASSSFTHTLTYAFGSLSGTIATKTSSTSVKWTLPTTFYAQMPSAKSKTGTITCTTYNGSTSIGTKTCSFTANVSSASAPTLAPTVKDSNATTKALTGDEAKFIKYYSSAAFTTGAAAQNSATLKSQKVTCGAKSSTSASGTLSAVERGTFIFTATDSRGFTTTQTLTKTLINYVKLTCSMKVSTPTADGKCAVSISGNYFNGSFGAADNKLTVQYRQSTDGGSTWGSWTAATATKSGNSYSAEVELTGLDYQQAYTFQARAVDKLATVNTATKTVKAAPVFEWGEDSFNFNVYAYVKNNSAYRSYSAAGEPRNVAYINASDAYRYGQGSWQNNEGAAYFEGNEVNIQSRGGISITSPTAGLSARNYGVNKVLWSGVYYMAENQTATLSEAVSAQPHGIVLVWAPYINGAAAGYGYSYNFIPKEHAALRSAGGIDIPLFRSASFSKAAIKYVFVKDTTIEGYSTNKNTGTGSAGITYDNSYWVLVRVIGV